MDIANMHIQNIQVMSKIDGIILGGSNSFFSLSAEIFSSKRNEDWYNFSLLDQARSDKNYWSFIETSLSESNRADIKTVIYSSLSPMGKNHITERMDNKYGLEGDTAFKVVPKISFASHLKKFLKNQNFNQNNKKIHPLPNKFGDFKFNEYLCELDEINLSFKRNTNRTELISWLENELSSINKLFQNAKIFIVLPSEFYRKGNNDAMKINLTSKILASGIKDFSIKFDTEVYLVHQPPFPSRDMMCDARHHANQEGRIFRSTNLLESL